MEWCFKKYFSEKTKTHFNCRNLVFKMGVRRKKKRLTFLKLTSLQEFTICLRNKEFIPVNIFKCNSCTTDNCAKWVFGNVHG